MSGSTNRATSFDCKDAFSHATEVTCEVMMKKLHTSTTLMMVGIEVTLNGALRYLLPESFQLYVQKSGSFSLHSRPTDGIDELRHTLLYLRRR